MVPPFVSYMMLIKKRFMYFLLDTSSSRNSLPSQCHPSLLMTRTGESFQGDFSPFNLHHGTVFLDGVLSHVGLDNSSLGEDCLACYRTFKIPGPYPLNASSIP